MRSKRVAGREGNRRACAGRLDALAVTCLDRMTAVGEWKLAMGYAGYSLTQGPWQDLDFQGRLTEELKTAQPRYRAWAGSPDAHAAELAERLGKPLAVTSWGKTARDKILHFPAL